MLALALAGCAGRAPAPLPARFATVVCRDRALQVEVAADGASRERGLMFRRSLDADAGMLFVFPVPQAASFWMKDTYIPLTIAFLDENGRIVNLADMEPFDTGTLHRSDGMVKYALETNRGWFVEHGVGPGDTCDLHEAD